MSSENTRDRMYPYTERLATFEGVKIPKRRKKVQWPHEHPDPEQLARAGFYFAPTAHSPDNVTCFLCECSLDGWELDDCPLREHLEHSRTCSFAQIQSKEWKNDKDHDPHSTEIVGMRLDTFSNIKNKWPHEGKRGWPQSFKLAEAGFYYCPTIPEEDLVVCAYCDISLDGWERNDDPYHEHKRRRPDCHFFVTETKSESSKKRRSSKRASKKIQEIAEVGNDSVQILSESEDLKPIRSKKEGRRSNKKTAPIIRQVSVEEELAKLQKEMEEDGDISAAVEEPKEGESDLELDHELSEMAKQADNIVHNFEEEGISDFEEPHHHEPTPVKKSNKRPSDVFHAEPLPPAKRRKSSVVPSAPVARISLPVSEDNENWEVFSGSSSPAPEEVDDEEAGEEVELVATVEEDAEESESADSDDSEEEDDEEEFVEAKENLTEDSCVIVSPAKATEEVEAEVEHNVGTKEIKKEPEEAPVHKKESIKPKTKDTQGTPLKTRDSELRSGRRSERRSRAITRSPLAVRNLNQIVKSSTSTPIKSAAGLFPKWEPVDCDQVFDVCVNSPQKETDHLDMTISEWYAYQSLEAEKRLIEKCNRMIEVVQREGQRALNHIKALPTVDGQ